MPLHPGKYAEMLGKKINEHQVKVWLINTGWTGGPYGIGNRIKLAYTRAMVKAVLEGLLTDVKFENDPIFGIAMPVECPGVPSEILNPVSTWPDKRAYQDQAKCLASRFIENFKQYESGVSAEILASGPRF